MKKERFDQDNFSAKVNPTKPLPLPPLPKTHYAESKEYVLKKLVKKIKQMASAPHLMAQERLDQILRMIKEFEK